jgi:transcriptional regulator with PAS, ATPase and Fis domain
MQEHGISVLLQGESGSGKEVFAHELHSGGTRASGPFVAVNCAALPETLIEAELFGHVGGAFTGARREGSPGRIREADGGTLFLDEIGDMPLPMQARLLRVLQERQVTPLGGSKAVAVDFFLVCATHRNLRAEVRAGRFREDLYYRLNGLTVQLPALRERRDFFTLTAQLLRSIVPQHPPAIHPDLLSALQAYRWPGNVRQLHNVLRAACALLEPGETQLQWAHMPEDLLEELAGDGNQTPAQDSADATDLRQLSTRVIEQVIEATQGNMSEAARRLGISRNTLYRRIKRGAGSA